MSISNIFSGGKQLAQGNKGVKQHEKQYHPFSEIRRTQTHKNQ